MKLLCGSNFKKANIVKRKFVIDTYIVPMSHRPLMLDSHQGDKVNNLKKQTY
jgi:hypothetical protein